MKIKTYLLPVLALLTGLTITWCCTKPTKDFVINISSNIINYKTTLHFVDATGGNSIPAGLTVSLDGPDASKIYDYSGTKELKLEESTGTLTVGVDPRYNPTGNVLSFNVKSSAPNYLTVNTPLTVASTERNQAYVVTMINLNNTPAGVKAVQPTAAISGGTAGTPVQAATTADATTTTTAAVTVPTGTQFRDANNNLINGSSVKVVVAAFDPAQPQAMQAFPGGQLQTQVVGGSASEVFMLPAAFTTVNMSIGNTEVRNFSAPITIQLGVNTNTFNPSTNAVVKVGDNLNIYSYQVQTGSWTFEKTAPVTNVGGKLVVEFTTTHLTTFAACVPPGNVRPCTGSKPYLVFNAPGIDPASSDVFIVDIYPTGVGANPAPIYSQYVPVHNGDSLQLTSLPTGNLNIQVSRVDYDHYQLSDYKNRGANVGSATATLCGSSTIPVNISFNGSNYLKGTGVAVCPNDNSKVYLPPNDAEVYYRRSGTGDAYRILGFIVDESVTTTLLTPGERYDIKGNYGGKLVGRSNITIRTGTSFLDSIHIINNGSSFCP